MKIVAFDFDGTITTKDTLFEFIKFTDGRFRLYVALALLSPFILASLMKIYPRAKAKERLIRYFYKGEPLWRFDGLSRIFENDLDAIIRPKARQAIKEEIQKGNTVVIISASLENWILPWAQRQGVTEVIATKPEVDAKGLLTGRFATPNCSGKEKVNRLLEIYPERETYELWAYGDSRGDRELLLLADKGVYNAFL